MQARGSGVEYISECAPDIWILKLVTGFERFFRKDALAIENQSGFLSQQRFQYECRNREKRRSLQHFANCPGEFFISYRSGGGGIQRTLQFCLLDRMEHQTGYVCDVNPWHPLLPISQVPA